MEPKTPMPQLSPKWHVRVFRNNFSVALLVVLAVKGSTTFKTYLKNVQSL